MFKRTGGDYSKLTADEKSTYVKSFAGNETAALEYWEKLKAGTSRNNVPAPR